MATVQWGGAHPASLGVGPERRQQQEQEQGQSRQGTGAGDPGPAPHGSSWAAVRGGRRQEQSRQGRWGSRLPGND